MSLNDRLRRLERAAGPTPDPCPNCKTRWVTIGPDEEIPPVPPCLHPSRCPVAGGVRQIVTVRPCERGALHVVE